MLDDGRRQAQHPIPTVPMTVYEPTAYGYPDSDSGAARARRRVQGWDARARRYFGGGGLRWLDAGSRFVLNDHPRHPERDDADRTFLVVEARWFIENNVPIGQPLAEFPLSLRATLAQQQAVHGARFATPSHEDGTAGFFMLEVEAQDARVEYRSPLEHPKPAMSIEHAIVVTQEGIEAWSNERNQVRVHFAWDRKNPDGAFSSSPLLSSMQADTGNGYGAVHVPRAGEWVLVGYWGNDCDKPFILGRVNGGTTPAPWHTNVLLSGFRSRGFGNTGAYNAFVHDDATHQGGTRLISYTGKSYAALAQGYLIQQDGNTRGRYLGQGFVLHADEYGAVRASKGLSISTHPKAYDDEQLSVDEARAQLQKAGMLVESLSSASTTAQAESLQAAQDALKDLTTAMQHAVSGQTSGGVTAGGGIGSANGFAKPAIVIATPADFAAVADRSAHVVAEGEVNMISGGNTQLASGKSLIAAAAEKISLFVQKAGMKLFAAKGPIEVSAHTDEIKLNSAKDTSLFSKKRIVLEATDELILKCGGSYLRLTKEGIEDGTRGARSIKSASFSRQGPSSVAEYMNSLPSAKFNDPYVLRDRITAVSHQLSNLESQIGQPLFQRSGRGLVLTPTGERYLADVTGSLADLSRATERASSRTEVDILRVHSSPSFGLMWLLPRLSSFQEANGDIQLNLACSYENVSFSNGFYDIDVRHGYGNWDNLEVRTVRGEFIAPLASPGYLERHPVNTPEDLLAHRLIYSETPLVQWKQRFGRTGVPRAAQKTFDFSFDRSYMSLETAALGLGIALESLMLASVKIREGLLVPVFDDTHAVEVSAHHLVYPRQNAELPRVKRFLAWIEREVATQGRAG
jgi:uncharacterized protein (DUF2345 family)/DNA-binding transcriptional LysR family regulator